MPQVGSYCAGEMSTHNSPFPSYLKRGILEEPTRYLIGGSLALRQRKYNHQKVLFRYYFGQEIVLGRRDDEMNYFLFNAVRLQETSFCSVRGAVPQCLSERVMQLFP
jgi:hypothetical protein